MSEPPPPPPPPPRPVLPVVPVVALEYATPQPRWRIGKIPGDAVLDVLVAGLSVLVNLAILDERKHAEISSLEAVASIAWSLFLLICAMTLALRLRLSESLHRVWAWGKLVLAAVAIAGLVVHSDDDFVLQTIVATAGGVIYAALLIRLGVYVEQVLDPPRAPIK